MVWLVAAGLAVVGCSTTGANTNTTSNASGTAASNDNANRTANTTGSTTGSASRSDANRGYPDHAVVNMNKDQLKSAPAFQYVR